MFTDAGPDTAPTHRLVIRDWAASDANIPHPLAIENTVLDKAMAVGTTVHITVSESAAIDGVTEVQQVPADDRILAGEPPEYRAELPQDRAVIQSLLQFDADDRDSRQTRRFGIDAIVVRTDSDWIYRSVPHHVHLRELNLAGRDQLYAQLQSALVPMPGVAIVPTGGLVSWTGDDARYQLVWDRFRYCERGTDQWTSIPLTDLQHVTVRPCQSGGVVELDWQSLSERPLLGRMLGWVSRFRSGQPPSTIPVPTTDTFVALRAAFNSLHTKLDYQYTISEGEKSDREPRNDV